MENKLMMKLTVATEAVFFISLILAYLFFWRSGHFKTAVINNLDIRSTGIFTVALLSSSITFRIAARQHKKGKTRGVKIWLLTTIILGLIFLAGQGKEYYGLISNHITISQGEFGGSFYALTGFHGLHVLLGIIILAITTGLVFSKQNQLISTSFINTIGIYWHFVDAVWVVVFSVIYLLPYIL